MAKWLLLAVLTIASLGLFAAMRPVARKPLAIGRRDGALRKIERVAKRQAKIVGATLHDAMPNVRGLI